MLGVGSPERCWLMVNSWVRGKMYLAHRLAYVWLGGESLPSSLTIDHGCRNRRCVNPEHLEPVDLVTNVMRGESSPARNARKVRCEEGHEFEVRPGGNRMCRECQRRLCRDYRRAKLSDPQARERDRQQQRAYYAAHREQRAQAREYWRQRRGGDLSACN